MLRHPAIDQATAALAALGLPKKITALHSAGVKKQRTLLGGSHSVVTYPPLDSLHPVKATEVIQTFNSSEVHLYIHIPFCETRCTFCHYVVSIYRGSKEPLQKQQAVEIYLAALKREMEIYSQLFKNKKITIKSIYIGGGTPTILTTNQLDAFFKNIFSLFNIQQDADFCIEASPLTLTASDGSKKLHLFKQVGVTRLSFGIQSFDNTILRLAGRGYTKEVAIRACTLAAEYFENWNIDLIQSLYKGGLEEILENVAMIKTLKPSHITWYNGRFSYERPQGQWRDSEATKNDFESEWDTLVGRMLIWQELLALGYKQIDGNRFVKDGSYADPFKKIRTSVNSSLIGLGVSAYSHTEKWFFRNTSIIQEYMKLLKTTSFPPILSGRFLTQEEKIAGSYVVGLRTMRSNAVIKKTTFSKDLVDQYTSLTNQLESLNLIERCTNTAGSDGIQLTQLGRLFEDEVLAQFYSPTVRKKLGDKQ